MSSIEDSSPTTSSAPALNREQYGSVKDFQCDPNSFNTTAVGILRYYFLSGWEVDTVNDTSSCIAISITAFLR